MICLIRIPYLASAWNVYWTTATTNNHGPPKPLKVVITLYSSFPDPDLYLHGQAKPPILLLFAILATKYVGSSADSDSPSLLSTGLLWAWKMLICSHTLSTIA